MDINNKDSVKINMNKKLIKITLIFFSSISLLIIALFLIGTFYITHRTKGDYFNSDGVQIHYNVEGSGEPIILIHGFAVNADLNWRRTGIIKLLSPNFKVIAIDLRGHGLSEKPHDPKLYGVNMVKDIANLMDTLKISRAHIAGYSLGGFIAIKFATLYPEKVKTLCVLGSGWEKPDEENFFHRALQKSIKLLENKSGIEPLSTKIEKNRRTGYIHRLWVRALTKYFNDNEALIALLKNIIQLQVSQEDLQKILCPICIIVGEKDPLRKGAENLHSAVPHSELTIIPDKDHLTTPISKDFHSALKNFLLKHSN